jgi:membrane protease YdiL (CAAX protease family)
MATGHLAHRAPTEPPITDRDDTRGRASAAHAAAQPDAPATGLRALIRRHPVATYLLLTTAGAWLGQLPVLFFGVPMLPFPFGAIFSALVLALPAFLVTAIADGPAGVRNLLARALRWRVGWRWYALALLGLPGASLLLATTVLGAAPLAALADKWPLIVTAYLPKVLLALVTAQLFEELGWTGFVQQRLQDRRGALPASLLVALAFALWHVPNYLIGAPVTGERVLGVLAQMLPVAIVFGVFFRTLVTWCYNGAGRSVPVAALAHAAFNTVSNAELATAFVPRWAAMWLPLAAVAVLAVLAAVATHGRLAHARRRDDGD